MHRGASSSMATQRHRRAQAVVFAGAVAGLLALTWLITGERPALPLLFLPLGGLAHGSSAAKTLGRACRRLARKRVLAASLVGVLAIAVSAAISLGVRMPQPRVHDEFSYLLAADTFARGRLTNPTHRFWMHFESPHVIHQPSYMSKYPPAQGLVLAIGQVAAGHPLAGVWLSAGLGSAALTWMLAGWMPARWALAGGLLALVHPLTIDWSQSYWGGNVPVLGGSLVLGTLARLVRRPRAWHGAILGVGLAILANSRPYEGLLLAIPLAVVLGAWLVRQPWPVARRVARRVGGPLAVVLAATGCWMLYYNHRITGNPLTSPYVVHERTYAAYPPLLFLGPRPIPAYRNEQVRRFHVEWALPAYLTQRTLAGVVAGVHSRLLSLVDAFFPGALVVLVLVGLRVPAERTGWYQFASTCVLLVGAGLSATVWTHPHYAAPVAGLVLQLTLRAVRCVGLWRWGSLRVGRAVAQALLLLLLAGLVVASVAEIRRWSTAGWQFERAHLAAALAAGPERHLVVVRYDPEYSAHAEWVYNGADIDTASVVWARELDADATAQLLDYFRLRRPWLLELTRTSVDLRPYPTALAPGASSSVPPSPPAVESSSMPREVSR